ncbi:MAG: IS110 family transposase [Chitinophagales bacterium]
MKKVVKQVVGIDVAQKELVVCLARMFDDWTPELYARKAFKNTSKGHLALMIWVKKFTEQTAKVRYVMEATGVYHESLAYFLEGKGHLVSIILPNKISNYFKTLDIKTVTDKTASEAIALFGVERKLDNWKKPKPVYKKLRQLTRERDQIVKERSIVKNQLHAENAEAESNRSSLKRLKQRVKLLNKQEAEIKTEISVLAKEEEETKKAVKLISTIPGVGDLTAATILAETNGFELIRNKRQLTGYAGLDVREKQSGTSVNGKARISKRGNKYLRKALHMPALAAISFNERKKDIYTRLVSKHGIKMKGVVAVQRKILELSYILVKNNQPYDPYYERKIEMQKAKLIEVVGSSLWLPTIQADLKSPSKSKLIKNTLGY